MKYGIAHGRFQPLHIQHLEYMLSVKNHCEHLVVAVTNPFQHSRRLEAASPHRHLNEANPLSFFERYSVISKALVAEGLEPNKFSIVPLDLFQPGTWPDCLPNRTESKFFIRIFSTWEEEKMALFEEHGFQCEAVDVGCAKRMTGSQVRELIRSGDSTEWKRLVPSATMDFIDQMGGRI